MRHSGRWMAAVLITVGLGMAGCTRPAANPAGGHKESPAKVEAIPGKDVKKVTLTEQATHRLDIRTVPIGAAPSAVPGATPPAPGSRQGTSVIVVPYSAVVYDPDGGTWVYTVPQPLTYVREKVVVATVGGTNGTEAVLSDGPAAGTTVVSVGAFELYGAELGVGK
jgi:hypothetical protein